MFEMRNQKGEQVKDPLINVKLRVVLLSTVSEKFTSGKPCFELKMKRILRVVVPCILV